MSGGTPFFFGIGHARHGEGGGTKPRKIRDFTDRREGVADGRRGGREGGREGGRGAQHSHQERREGHEGQAHDQRPLPAVPVPDASDDEAPHRSHQERTPVHREAGDQSRCRLLGVPAIPAAIGRGGEEHGGYDVAEESEEGEVVPGGGRRDDEETEPDTGAVAADVGPIIGVEADVRGGTKMINTRRRR